jgi:hypothetical protein
MIVKARTVARARGAAKQATWAVKAIIVARARAVAKWLEAPEAGLVGFPSITLLGERGGQRFALLSLPPYRQNVCLLTLSME